MHLHMSSPAVSLVCSETERAKVISVHGLTRIKPNILPSQDIRFIPKDSSRLSPGPSLVFTRYCHHKFCMLYGIQRRGRWGGIFCTMVVQQYYNRVGFAGGGDNKHMIDSHNKALEWDNVL